jgi:asparagine synthase (glutamine-hydrolysing)
MCSISGCFSKSDIEYITNSLKHRGPDNSKIVNFNGLYLGHNLLSITGFVKQPLQNKNFILITNCEIYNYKELAKKENIIVNSDSELLFKLLQKNYKNPTKILSKLNGDYSIAFFYLQNNFIKGFLTRDIFGIKPLWYYYDKNNFYFSSEKKALPKNIKIKAADLNPRILLDLSYNIKTKELKLKEKYKGFFKNKFVDVDYNIAKLKTEKLLKRSIELRLESNKKTAVLISGGIDSSLIAFYSKFSSNVYYYNVYSNENDSDFIFSKKLEKELNIKITYLKISEKEIHSNITKVANIIESYDNVKLSVALPFYFLAKQLKKDKIKVVLIGNGADNIFCGYNRFLYNYSPTKDSISSLRKLYDSDCYRDDLIFMNFGIEARYPYLDYNLVKYVLSLKDEYKINSERKKIILRDIALKYLSKELAERKKKAIQYGSGFNKIFIKKTELKKDFKNEKLVCLFSGGKDSVLALHILKNMNYDISCLISIVSKNKDSYMYHTPNMHLVDLQAEALQIPLIKIHTSGKKEDELNVLKKALRIAKKKYFVTGVITGAIYSNYQRDRIENISDRLNLKVFSPLWHYSQEDVLKELINLKINAIITKIAAYGLNRTYLNKHIDKDILSHLIFLNTKFGFNIAGEGGEYESLVLDCPLFTKKIILEKTKIKEENENTCELIIEKAKLIKK